MIEYEMIRRRQDEIRRNVERVRLAREARRSLRIVAGTALARLGLRLAGPMALSAALREAR